MAQPSTELKQNLASPALRAGLDKFFSERLAEIKTSMLRTTDHALLHQMQGRGLELEDLRSALTQEK